MDYMIQKENEKSLLEHQSKKIIDDIVEKLIDYRIEKGLTQQNIADITGIKRSNVARIEGKKRGTSLESLMRYADSLGLTISFSVINGEDGNKDARVNIVTDEHGKNIVVINDIRFKGKRSIDWDEVEKYLKEYVGKCFEISETSEKIYIGSDFPDEFAHSKDTKVLKGANAKAKANSSQVIGEMIQIATNRAQSPDYQSRHKNKAKYGWYRYDTRFALPIYDEEGELQRYNIFSVRMLVRHDKDGKMYLYDMLRTKKETSRPL